MEKIELEDFEQETLTFRCGKHIIEYTKYIPPVVLMGVISDYIEYLFADGDPHTNYLFAEYALMVRIVDQCTNINVQNDKKIADKLILSGIWETLQKSIANYWEMRDEIRSVVKLESDKRSLSSQITSLLDKLTGVVDSIAKMDFSETSVKTLTETFDKLSGNMTELNQTLGNNKNGKTRRSKSKEDVQQQS